MTFQRFLLLACVCSMSDYGDEDRYYCDSDGSCGSEGDAHDVNDAFLERSDRESREGGLCSS